MVSGSKLLVEGLGQEYAVLVGSVVTAFVVVNLVIPGKVMIARKKYGVEYPALYASIVDVDGKKYTDAKDVTSAEKFNCTQRGHQNTLESYGGVLSMTLTAAIAHPLAASAGILLWTFGAYMYACNYDSSGAKARNNGLAVAKYLGLVTLLFANFSVIYKIMQN